MGGAFGFAIGGPIGAIVGVAFGLLLGGRALETHWSWHLGDPARIQAAFFTTTFSVMGHIAKADGRVSEREIRAAEAVMAHMNLSREQRDAAIRLFNEGKRINFPLRDVLAQFRQECGRRRDLFRVFLELQVQAALADGSLHGAERAVLRIICDTLGLPRSEIRRLEAILRARQRTGAGPGAAPTPRDKLTGAYQVLGLTRSASNAEVKKAYRRLMHENHPDKLVARGLPEEMIKLAAEKTRQVNVAYDTIKEARGMK
jgi:DnaJ like chaperone protein